jgi:long-chain fatty acid transport protein
MSVQRTTLLGSVAVVALIAVSATASAGGFAIREQSVESQGASFAGSAAGGGGLSGMFWNPAITATKDGMNSDSNYSLIVPNAEIHVDKAHSHPALGAFAADSGNIAGVAVVPASYFNYQFKNFDPNLYIGLGINSPFGLTTEPENPNYGGAVLGRTSKLFTMNFNPTLAYKITPAISIGAGLQVMYADGSFKFAAGLPNAPTAGFEGNDIAVGFTAGINLNPVAGTNIGLGYRSRMNEKLEGSFFAPGVILNANVDLKLPDIVTLSIRQAIAPNMRLLGTVEWTNWSVFEELRVKRQGASDIAIPANWSDSWLFSVGAEYDMNRALTLRTGVGYEISPVDDPTKRIVGIPDSDRIWASLGGSYKWTESTTIDFAYTHIFLKDESLRRTSVAAGLPVVADVEAKTDILSVALKTKW